MAIYLGTNELSIGGGSGGCSKITTIDGTVYSAPYEDPILIDSVAVGRGSGVSNALPALTLAVDTTYLETDSTKITSYTETQSGTTELTNQGVEATLVSLTGSGAFLNASMLYSALGEGAYGTYQNKYMTTPAGTLKIVIDGTTYTFGFPSLESFGNSGGSGGMTKMTTRQSVFVGAVPISYEVNNNSYISNIGIAPVASYAAQEKTLGYDLYTEGTSLIAKCGVPGNNQWFNLGLPWVKYENSLVIKYTSPGNSSVTTRHDRTLHVYAQYHPFS